MHDDVIKDLKIMLIARPDQIEGGEDTIDEIIELARHAKAVMNLRELIIDEKNCPYCMQPITADDFKGLDKSYLMEYQISGLCARCQDEVFQP